MFILYDLIKDSLNTYALYVERQLMGSDTPLVTLMVRMFFLVLMPFFILIATPLLIIIVLLTWVAAIT